VSAGRRPYAKLLVLDLDETLIHARGRDEPALPWPAQRKVAQFSVHLRPGVREFMTAVLERFVGVGVWTSASTDYATAMLDRIVDRGRLRFIFARDRCTHGWDERGEVYWHKDICELDGFGFDARQILVVDDKPRGLERSSVNLVRVRPFAGDPDDRELAMLLRYLEQLGPIEDVRAVDKARWWERFEADELDELDIDIELVPD
jgi:TFIIF-interacting CTD phosphatase-like protein